MPIIIHPQGQVRDVSDTKVPDYLALGWELAAGQPTLASEPDMSWRRDDIVSYARDLGVDFDEKATKRELLEALDIPPPVVPGEE